MPSSTSISTPSMVSFAIFRPPLRRRPRPVGRDPIFDFVPKCRDQALDRPRRRVAERAPCAPRSRGKRREARSGSPTGPASPVTSRSITHCHPAGALAAGRALAAALVFVELRQTRDRRDDVGRLVHHDDRRGAEAGPHRAASLKSTGCCRRCLSAGTHRRTTRNDRLEVIPARPRTPLVCLSMSSLSGTLHLSSFYVARVIFMRPGDAEDLGARIVLAPEASEPRRARRQIVGETAIVSTLLIVVGQP